MVNPDFEVDHNMFPVCRTVRSAAQDTKQSSAPAGTPVGSGRKVYVLDSKLLLSVRKRTALREMGALVCNFCPLQAAMQL